MTGRLFRHKSWSSRVKAPKYLQVISRTRGDPKKSPTPQDPREAKIIENLGQLKIEFRLVGKIGGHQTRFNCSVADFGIVK